MENPHPDECPDDRKGYDKHDDEGVSPVVQEHQDDKGDQQNGEQQVSEHRPDRFTGEGGRVRNGLNRQLDVGVVTFKDFADLRYAVAQVDGIGVALLEGVQEDSILSVDARQFVHILRGLGDLGDVRQADLRAGGKRHDHEIPDFLHTIQLAGKAQNGMGFFASEASRREVQIGCPKGSQYLDGRDSQRADHFHVEIDLNFPGMLSDRVYFRHARNPEKFRKDVPIDEIGESHGFER